MQDPREDPREDPRTDPRTLQANERTLLAWLRTGVSMITFGFVIAKADFWMRVPASAGSAVKPIRGAETIGAVFVLLGAVCEIIGLVRYLRVRRALLERRSVPVGATEIVTIGFTVAVLGLFLAFYSAF